MHQEEARRTQTLPGSKRLESWIGLTRVGPTSISKLQTCCCTQTSLRTVRPRKWHVCRTTLAARKPMQSMATDLILFLFCTDSASFCVRYPQQTHFGFSPKFQIVCPETLVNSYGGFVRIFGKHRSEKKEFLDDKICTQGLQKHFNKAMKNLDVCEQDHFSRCLLQCAVCVEM